MILRPFVTIEYEKRAKAMEVMLSNKNKITPSIPHRNATPALLAGLATKMNNMGFQDLKKTLNTNKQTQLVIVSNSDKAKMKRKATLLANNEKRLTMSTTLKPEIIQKQSDDQWKLDMMDADKENTEVDDKSRKADYDAKIDKLTKMVFNLQASFDKR